jgi:hypothetical protein
MQEKHCGMTWRFSSVGSPDVAQEAQPTEMVGSEILSTPQCLRLLTSLLQLLLLLLC